MSRVRGLPADPERRADLLPARAVVAGSFHKQSLDALERRAELDDILQSVVRTLKTGDKLRDPRIPAGSVHAAIFKRTEVPNKWPFPTCPRVNAGAGDSPRRRA